MSAQFFPTFAFAPQKPFKSFGVGWFQSIYFCFTVIWLKEMGSSVITSHRKSVSGILNDC